jgi:hypothetical protein
LVEKAKRRRFTAEYKLRVLKQAEACTRPGEIGALLRREGLYTSHLTPRRSRGQCVLGIPERQGSGPPCGDHATAPVARAMAPSAAVVGDAVCTPPLCQARLRR